MILGIQAMGTGHAFARGHGNTGSTTVVATQSGSPTTSQPVECVPAGVQGSADTCDNGYEYYCSVTYYVPGNFYALEQNGYYEFGAGVDFNGNSVPNNSPVYDPADACYPPD